MVERDKPEISLSAQAGILSISRSSLYYKPLPPTADELNAAYEHGYVLQYDETSIQQARANHELVKDVAIGSLLGYLEKVK